MYRILVRKPHGNISGHTYTCHEYRMTCRLIIWTHTEEKRWRELDRITFRGKQRVDLMQTHCQDRRQTKQARIPSYGKHSSPSSSHATSTPFTPHAFNQEHHVKNNVKNEAQK
jgi:hypothetical protein